MQNYVVQVVAKPGHEEPVTRFYQELEPLLREAKGFRGRKMLRGQTGVMAAAVKKLYTEEELAKHAEPPHEDTGTQFVIIEGWDSVEDRMLFSKNVQGSRTKDLIGHLLPQHSHEFFEDISID
ncbi:MAG: hypothetical protein OER85_04675 [Gammaproteobacteria bacterium]|nr:hypothetical protein [Gammaproteobacteria bacterium]